jgi:hypothetical protein
VTAFESGAACALTVRHITVTIGFGERNHIAVRINELRLRRMIIMRFN